MAKIKIAVDAGHGSNTAGKRTPPFTKNIDINKDGVIDVKKGSSYREHYANVGVANILYKILAARGYDVIKSGWNDENSENDADTAVSVRQKAIKKAKCDYSVSIHFNAYGDGKSFNTGNGVAVYIHSINPGASKKFGEYILQELVKNTKQKNRGIVSNNLALCNCKALGTKASVICELAFMTNEHEAQDLMANKIFWEESAYEIANAIDAYCKS
jgi:N-acetylmuramoyl-L-alanine amidase